MSDSKVKPGISSFYISPQLPVTKQQCEVLDMLLAAVRQQGFPVLIRKSVFREPASGVDGAIGPLLYEKVISFSEATDGSVRIDVVYYPDVKRHQTSGPRFQGS
jgi:hypothetical protein